MEFHFILVEPAVPENIGASARAMNTMGFRSLRLVNPGDHLCEKARMLAHGSSEILEQATLYTSLSEALHGADLVIGTTAKKRSVKEDYFNSHRLPQFLKRKSRSVKSVAMVFGREESGLTNEEVMLCHIMTTIPMKAAFPSLNLAQSVMIYAYLLSDLNSGNVRDSRMQRDPRSLKTLMERIEKILELTGIRENTTLSNRIMERAASLEDEDIHLLHSITGKVLPKLINRK